MHKARRTNMSFLCIKTVFFDNSIGWEVQMTVFSSWPKLPNALATFSGIIKEEVAILIQICWPNHDFVAQIYNRWFEMRSWWHESEISGRLWADNEYIAMNQLCSLHIKKASFNFPSVTPSSDSLAHILVLLLLLQQGCICRKVERRSELCGRQLQHSRW